MLRSKGCSLEKEKCCARATGESNVSESRKRQPGAECREGMCYLHQHSEAAYAAEGRDHGSGCEGGQAGDGVVLVWHPPVQVAGVPRRRSRGEASGGHTDAASAEEGTGNERHFQ